MGVRMKKKSARAYALGPGVGSIGKSRKQYTKHCGNMRVCWLHARQKWTCLCLGYIIVNVLEVYVFHLPTNGTHRYHSDVDCEADEFSSQPMLSFHDPSWYRPRDMFIIWGYQLFRRPFGDHLP